MFNRPARRIAGATLLASVLQLPLGLWLVTEISPASRAAIMGKSAVASLMFLMAILFVLLLLGRLVKIALGEFAKEDLRKAALWIVLVVLAMAISTQTARANVPFARLEDPQKRGHGERVSVAPEILEDEGFRA